MSSDHTVEKKNPAIGAGYSQTNLAYLEQDSVPQGPPFRRVDTEIEPTPHYASYPILGKCEEGDWISWIQLADGLYEEVNRQVHEDHDEFIFKRRQALIDKLTEIQNKTIQKANAGETGKEHSALNQQFIYTDKDEIIYRYPEAYTMPSVKRCEESSGHSYVSCSTISVEGMPGVTVAKIQQ